MPIAPATIPERRRRFDRLRSIAWKLLRVYLVVILVLALLQKKLIFIGASTQGTPEAQVSAVDSELLHLHTPNGTAPPIPIAALFGKSMNPSINPATAPTILWFYGNAMCMNDALSEFLLFRRLGANVLLVDYAGYGMSGGDASEEGCYQAAEAAYQYLLTRPDIDTHKLIPAGWSLGGAVAIDLAARHAAETHIAGVMTFCTFTSMAELAQLHYPFVPVKLLLTRRFASEEKIGKIRVPMLIGHGRRDSIVPFAMSDRLAKAVAGKVLRIESPAADHNDFFDVAADQVEQSVAEFLRNLQA